MFGLYFMVVGATTHKATVAEARTELFRNPGTRLYHSAQRKAARLILTTTTSSTYPAPPPVLSYLTPKYAQFPQLSELGASGEMGS